VAVATGAGVGVKFLLPVGCGVGVGAAAANGVAVGVGAEIPMAVEPDEDPLLPVVADSLTAGDCDLKPPVQPANSAINGTISLHLAVCGTRKTNMSVSLRYRSLDLTILRRNRFARTSMFRTIMVSANSMPIIRERRMDFSDVA
jgi:hypothetical protein